MAGIILSVANSSTENSPGHAHALARDENNLRFVNMDCRALHPLFAPYIRNAQLTPNQQ